MFGFSVPCLPTYLPALISFLAMAWRWGTGVFFLGLGMGSWVGV